MRPRNNNILNIRFISISYQYRLRSRAPMYKCIWYLCIQGSRRSYILDTILPHNSPFMRQFGQNLCSHLKWITSCMVTELIETYYTYKSHKGIGSPIPISSRDQSKVGNYVPSSTKATRIQPTMLLIKFKKRQTSTRDRALHDLTLERHEITCNDGEKYFFHTRLAVGFNDPLLLPP